MTVWLQGTARHSVPPCPSIALSSILELLTLLLITIVTLFINVLGLLFIHSDLTDTRGLFSTSEFSDVVKKTSRKLF